MSPMYLRIAKMALIHADRYFTHILPQSQIFTRSVLCWRGILGTWRNFRRLRKGLIDLFLTKSGQQHDRLRGHAGAREAFHRRRFFIDRLAPAIIDLLLEVVLRALEFARHHLAD